MVCLWLPHSAYSLQVTIESGCLKAALKPLRVTQSTTPAPNCHQGHTITAYVYVYLSPLWCVQTVTMERERESAKNKVFSVIPNTEKSLTLHLSAFHVRFHFAMKNCSTLLYINFTYLDSEIYVHLWLNPNVMGATIQNNHRHHNFVVNTTLRKGGVPHLLKWADA